LAKRQAEKEVDIKFLNEGIRLSEEQQRARAQELIEM